MVTRNRLLMIAVPILALMICLISGDVNGQESEDVTGQQPNDAQQADAILDEFNLNEDEAEPAPPEQLASDELVAVPETEETKRTELQKKYLELVSRRAKGMSIEELNAALGETQRSINEQMAASQLKEVEIQLRRITEMFPATTGGRQAKRLIYNLEALRTAPAEFNQPGSAPYPFDAFSPPRDAPDSLDELRSSRPSFPSEPIPDTETRNFRQGPDSPTPSERYYPEK